MRPSGLTAPFFRIFGRKIFWPFALVSALVVGLLAAVNVASHSALERYIGDQIQRLPWDTAVYQTAEVPLAEELFTAVARTGGVEAAERLYFLRTIPPFTTVSQVDGVPLKTPWLSILTATDRSLLPPSLRPEGDGAVMALVGAKTQMGQAYLDLQGRRQYQLVARPGEQHEAAGHLTSWEAAGVRRPGDPPPEPDDHAEEDGAAHHPGEAGDAGGEHADDHPGAMISKRLERVIRVDATEINRWFMEQTSAPTLVPEIGVILVTAYDPALITAFDRMSRGFVHGHEGEDIHGSPGEYFVDVFHLLRYSRAAMVSGWDLGGSSARLDAVGAAIGKKVAALTLAAAVDNTLGVMLARMSAIAERISLVSLLVSIPLILIAGVLLGNLSSLLILNMRRNLGLLRLRGASGRSIGTAVLLSVGAGGLLGGLLGAALGSAAAISLYAGEWLPWPILLEVQSPSYLLAILLIGLGLALFTGRRLVRYAATISPLEASGRVAGSEVGTASVRFGIFQALALLLGGAKVVAWIGGFTASDLWQAPWIQEADRILDFVAFPLFVFGVTTLIASRPWIMSALLAPVVWMTAGKLRAPLLRHLETRRHRAAGLLLIAGLMTSLVLYPTVMISVFDDKTERGALVQLGGDLHVTLDALELMAEEAQARGDLGQRYESLRARLQPILSRLGALPEAGGVSSIVEGLVEGLYMPDRGFSGIPLYLIDEPRAHLATTYHEPSMGRGEPFERLIGRLGGGQVLLSEAMADFYKRPVDGPMPVGKSATGSLLKAPYGGALRFLPGSPLRTVNDREGFVGARVDYLNHLFGSSPYIIGRAADPALGALDVLMPRVVITVKAAPGVGPSRLRTAVLAALPAAPLEIRDAGLELSRLGSDMYIFLARQNVQLYLLGGLALACIGFFAVAAADYAQERRTVALLRLRGGGPAEVLRFVAPGVLAPALLGLALGAGVALVVGFGVTQVIWDLRELETVMSYLPTHLAISAGTVLTGALLVVLIGAVALFFGRRVMAHSLQHGLSDS